jgi:hypothetical protein
MTHMPRIYVLTLHSPSRTALRLWTGRNIHTLRHCSARQIDHVLDEMQESVDELQRTMRTLRDSKARSAAVQRKGRTG